MRKGILPLYRHPYADYMILQGGARDTNKWSMKYLTVNQDKHSQLRAGLLDIEPEANDYPINAESEATNFWNQFDFFNKFITLL